MSDAKHTRKAPVGGSFLISDVDAADILIPEAFDDEIKLFAQTAKTFVEREIKPDFEALEGLDYELSRQKMQKAGEMGLLAIEVAEDHGGLGMGKAASAVVTEAIAASGSFNVTFNAHTGIGTLPIVYFGTPEQKEKYLPKLASGEWVAAYALSEPESGSDSLAAKTRAVLDGDEWVLNGNKMWISNAGFADVFTVFAQVDGDKFSCFLVEKDAPGLSLAAEEKKMGIKGSSTRMVVLEDCRIPKENLLGEIGKGHLIAFGILNIGRFKLAVGAAGASKDLIDIATKYAMERHQFNVPIAKFGLIREKIGTMVAETFALESALYRMAGDMDSLTAGIDDAGEQLKALNDYAVEYSFIKVFGSEILDFVADEALQIHGGYGFSAEFPVELYYRNSRINRIFEGTNEINRALTIDQLLKRTMRGQLGLMGPAQAAATGAPVTEASGPAELQSARIALTNAKRGFLQLAGAAAMSLMQQLKDEQELIGKLADIVGYIYLSESALLRAERLFETKDKDVASVAARAYTFSAIDRIRALGMSVVRRLPGGAQAHGTRFAAYLDAVPVPDLIAFHRTLSDFAVAAEGYPLGS